MPMVSRVKGHISLLISCGTSVIAGLSIFYMLQILFVSEAMAASLAGLVSLLAFALSRYYSQPITDYSSTVSDDNPDNFNVPKSSAKSLDFIFLVGIYSVALVISAISNPNASVFINWSNVGSVDIVSLGAAILLTFFVPGYALVKMLTQKCKTDNILKVIFAYLSSILISGLTVYISATSFDVSAGEIKNTLLSVYVAILVIFILVYYIKNHDRLKIKFSSSISQSNYPPNTQNSFTSLTSERLNLAKKIKQARSWEFIVFACLFLLLVVSTYYTYGGITVGDQWFHQGRAITISSGSFREAVATGVESWYQPFQSMLISGLTVLSGAPLVNAYASIAFLNIIPLFAFYYFFSNWIAPHMRRAALIACTLFVLASGFGWIYLSGAMAIANNIPHSEHGAVETVDSVRSYILMPSNFILASHPDFSTALIYIALPAGLVLVGICNQSLYNKAVKTSIVATVTFIGILSHEEFYFFIIVASLALLIFRIKEANYVYAGIVMSLFVTFALNSAIPGGYYGLTEIFGIPLLYLGIFLVLVTWALHVGLRKAQILTFISKLRRARKKRAGTSSQFEAMWRRARGSRRIVILTQLIIPAITACVYISSIVILINLSPHEANEEALRGAVSWYQYPMKLGLMGLLGIAFILSYLFKRFEKVIFVFGLIIMIALITGPYYDQHRFSKYVMLGMIGFASVLLYKLLNVRYRYRTLVNPILITMVVMSASLSTVLFIGYNSLAFDNHEYAYDLGRRNFPSESEFKLLDAIRSNTDVISKKYNVISTPEEYNFYKGTLLTKISTFVGIPSDKLLQGRFVLNVTTLDSLYKLLDYSDARFIIIPKEHIKNESRLTQPIRFALDSFPHYYEDDKYVVLKVPALNSLSYSGSQDVAFVSSGNHDYISSPSVFNTTLLKYNNATFNSDQLRQVNNRNNIDGINSQTSNSLICDSKPNEGITVWSKGFDEIASPDINYLQVSFKIDSLNNKGWADSGIRWNEGDRQYYTSVTKNGLELYQKKIANDGKGEIDKKLLYQNNEVQQRKDVFYTLKIMSLNDALYVYVNDVLKAKVIRNSEKYDEGITKVGISCFNDAVQFSEIKVGTVKLPQNETAIERKKIYEHYYTLSIMALSKTGYETFLDADLSALSKKIVILSFDPLEWNADRFNLYMQYVKQGGTLVVINSDSNIKGQFSHLFWTENKGDANKTRFTTIGTGNEIANISGSVYPLSVNQTSNSKIIASYIDSAENSTREVAPFAIEKNFTNGGKIILVNAGAYFDALTELPEKFTSLSKVLDALDLRLPHTPLLFPTSQPPEQFVGSMDISGNVTLKSTSLLMSNNQNMHNEIRYDDSQSRITKAQWVKIYEDRQLKHTFEKASIKYLNLVGDYRVTIISKNLKLPYMTSHYNYIGVAMPKFNMTINLSDYPFSSAQLIIQNPDSTGSEIVDIRPGSTIKFDNIQSGLNKSDTDTNSEPTFTPILLKEPQIEADGNAKYTMLRFSWHYLEKIQYDAESLKTRLGYVDEYSEPLNNGTKTKYITFMNSTLNQ